MEKINVIALGACTIHDIIKCDPYFEERYNFQHYLGSITRSFHPRGKLGERVGNELADGKIKPKDYRISQMLNYITKEKGPMDYLQDIPPNSVVIVDYAYELLFFYYDTQEIFDIISNFDTIKTFLPSWLYKEIVPNIKHFDSGIQGVAREQHRLWRKFQCEILPSKNVPIIVFNNSFSNRIYDRRTNSVGEIINYPHALPTFLKKIPFKYQEGQNEFSKYNYSQRLLNYFYTNVKNLITPDVKIFDIESEMPYADPEHRFGYHPVHYHMTCRNVLWKKLRNTILEALADHKKKLVLPDPSKEIIKV